MHMADALLSPIVGGVMLCSSAAALSYSVSKVKSDSKKIPLMGVMGSFIFATQMINFSIPGTGSSGHFVGGILLACLLGPHAGFIVMSAVLLIQALFFGDGGVFALGCNIFNIGFLSCYIAYPFIFRPIINQCSKRGRHLLGLGSASVAAAVAAMLLSSFAVVMQTTMSGITQIPVLLFLGFMIPLHLIIGLVEGLITAAVIIFIYKSSSGLIHDIPGKNDIKTKTSEGKYSGNRLIPTIIIIATATTLLSLTLVGRSSTNPDGLEWSLLKFLPIDFFETTSFSIFGADINESAMSLIGGTITFGLIIGMGILIKWIVNLKKKKNE